MSSILRALKKLENEPRHLDESQTLENKFVPLADIGQPKKSPALLIMIIGGGLVCGLVILAGWWFLSEKPLRLESAPQQITQQYLQQPGSTPVMPEKSDLQPKPEPAAVNLPVPSSVSIEQREGMSIAQQKTVSSSRAPGAQSSEAVEPAPAEEITAANNTPPEISTNTVKKAEIPLLSDPEIKLQAITWSKDPQKRIAVINNSIVRQGEAVAGYRIDIINQDDVVLNDRGKKWKLLFRIR